MRVKICGLGQREQAQGIVALGIQTLGFICVEASPRYVSPAEIQFILEGLSPQIQAIGVFANVPLETIARVLDQADLTGIQLHGQESPAFCQQVKQSFPTQEVIKALRVASPTTLQQAEAYYEFVDTLLLDAYHPHQLGGTGQTLPWEMLQIFTPPIPWFLAGGLTPDNVRQALGILRPDGIDLASGVEKAPKDKDLEKVRQLMRQLTV